ncbi:MAG: Asp23/Gls24 family envelope stress response protein [Clostridia bacterium]
MEDEVKVPDGNIEISEAVIMTYVEKTIGEFNGLSIGKKKKSIKITRSEGGSTIDIGLDVNYGVAIPETVRELQREIKERLMKLAGMQVKEVNVIVEGLNIEELIKK